MANDGTVKIGAEIDEKEFKSGLSKLSGVAKAGLTGATAAIGAATAAATAGTVAVGKLAQSAISAYSDYEQLVGGVETLFKTSSATVMEYANNAYKTAGLSANEYMDTVTSFSASLLQGLGGDTEAAAQIADKAIVDMADNANKMGTDMASIQYAYQGFAKQNYTMLDNLKLGYGGTQAEMARLINDSGVLGDTMKVTAQTVNQVSFDKIIEAIHVVQERIGITGTTAQEASETIQGSVNAMKGAWENLITGMGDENANTDVLIENFVSSVETALNNLIPRLEVILSGIGELVTKLAPVIAEKLPGMMEALLPPLIQATGLLIQGLATALPDLLDVVMDAVHQSIDSIGQALAEEIPFLSGLFENLDSVVTAAAVAFVTLKTATMAYQAASAVAKVIQMLTAATEGQTIAQAALNAVMNANPFVLVATLIAGLVTALVTLYMTNETFRNKVNAAWSSVKGTISNSVEAIVKLFTESIPKAAQKAVDWFLDIPERMKTIGKDIVKKLWEGITGMGEWLRGKVDGFISGIISAVTGGGSKSSSSGISKARSAPESPNNPRPSPASMSPAGDFSGETAGNEGGSYSLTASDFSRAAAVRALESAIPNAVGRVSVSTAAMAPAAGDGGNRPRSLAAEVAEAVHNELNGMEVTMDGRTVGRMVTKQQNNIGRAFGTA